MATTTKPRLWQQHCCQHNGDDLSYCVDFILRHAMAQQQQSGCSNNICYPPAPRASTTCHVKVLTKNKLLRCTMATTYHLCCAMATTYNIALPNGDNWSYCIAWWRLIISYRTMVMTTILSCESTRRRAMASVRTTAMASHIISPCRMTMTMITMPCHKGSNTTTTVDKEATCYVKHRRCINY